MSDNVEVLDGAAATQFVKTTESGGIHTPHSHIDSVTPGTGIAHAGKAHDAAAASGHTGVAVLARRTATPADVAGTEGDYEFLQTKDGRLWVAATISDLVPGTGATNLGKAQDAVPGETDTGVAVLAVRKTTPANVAGTDGDYERLQINAGRLYTRTIVDLPTALVAESKTSSGAGSEVAFTTATVTTMLMASCPSSNVSDVFIHPLAVTGAQGIAIPPGCTVPLPPIDPAALEAHFIGAADKVYILGY